MDIDSEAWKWNGHRWIQNRTISIFDRGFRYGASVFETVYCRQGKLLFLTEHLERFQEARKALANQEVSEFPATKDLLREVSIWLGDRNAMLRFVATDGEDDRQQTLVVYIETAPAKIEKVASIKVILFPDSFSPVLYGHKTGSYLFHLRARRFAISTGADEAILVRENGEWVSGAMSNLFLVRNNEIVTPPLASGARHGVVRAWIAQEVGLTEKALFKEDFYQSEGIFVTNSRIGIQAVGEVDGKIISIPKDIISLRDKWTKRVEE